jgi:hypothetical protein
MATPYSVDTLIDYSFRRLGAPVVDINVDRQQAEERINDALDFFSERHFDGVEKHYYAHKVTSADISNGYINLNGLTAGNGAGYTGAPAGSNIVSVVNVYPFGSATSNMFNIKYQMSLNDYFGVNRSSSMGNSLGLAGYDSTKRFIGLVEDFFNTDKNFRFSKVTNRLYIDMDWSEDVDSGSYLLVETFATLNPNEFTEIYNDRLLKEYVTALLKRQWGSNLSKFEGVQLPGGVTLRGAELFTEANEEVQRIEEKVLLEYELPIDFTVG